MLSDDSLLALNAFCVLSSIVMYIFANRERQRCFQLVQDLKLSLGEMNALKIKITALETEFVDKFDYAMKKLTNRAGMRKAREEVEESETIKSPIVGL
jgi:hypothetical protein